jgi:BMFP domain-containing protein YqiC
MAPEDTPATKRDIYALEVRINGLEERLLERMRDMQTELLKAFLPYQEQTRLRDSALEARQSALEARANTVEVRLSEIEKKLFLNPPAA